MTELNPSSILFNNKKPVLDFALTTAYPLEIQQGNKTPTVYVYMTPYEPEELKNVLKKVTSGYKREKRDVELVNQDKSIYTPLCDAHFVKLGNATGTPESQKAWLEKYPEFKPTFVELTFGGVSMAPKAEDELDTILDISAELSGAVSVFQDIYDPETDKVVRVDMVHSHSHPTEGQFRDYRSARRSKFLRKSTLWTIAENHGMLEKLYDVVIQSISGAAVDAKPCVLSTKAEWLPKVPLWHKLLIVDQIFGELVEKNG